MNLRNLEPGKARFGALVVILMLALAILETASPIEAAHAADVAPAGSGSVRLSIPAQIPFAVKADGTVLSARTIAMSNADDDSIVEIVGLSTMPEPPASVALEGDIATFSLAGNALAFGPTAHSCTFPAPVTLSGATSATLLVSTTDARGEPLSRVSTFNATTALAQGMGHLAIKAIVRPRTVTVTFDDGCGNVQRVAVSHGDALDAHLPPDPWKEGHAFAGWVDGNGQAVTADTIVTEPMRVIARFTPVIAFAVYSADDDSLSFFKRLRTELPTVGDEIEGKTATAVYEGIEDMTYCPWRDYSSSIATVRTYEPIAPTSLGSWFSGCSRLTEVSALADWDVSQAKSLYALFDSCTSLVDVSALADWDVSSAEDLSHLFAFCPSLADVSSLADWDVSNVTTLQSAFHFARALDDISALAHWDTSKVTNLGDVFCFCSSLVDLSPLAGWDVSRVSTFQNAFSSCDSLIDASPLQGWDTASAQDLTGIFSYCYQLADISALANWDTSQVTSLSCSFLSCHGIADIAALSAWNTSCVTNLSLTFSHCLSITDLTPLSGWDASNATTMHATFYGCSGITDLTPLTGWNISQVQDLATAFSSCSALEDLSPLKGWDTSSVVAFDEMFSYSSIEVADLSGWTVNSEATTDGLFLCCDLLQKLVIGDGWHKPLDSCMLPAPSAERIPGADGLWHDPATGNAYAPAAIPLGTPATYLAAIEKSGAIEATSMAPLGL